MCLNTVISIKYMKSYSFKVFVLLSLFLLFPFYHLSAAVDLGDRFTYRSTVLGGGVEHKGTYVYAIQNQKNVFNSNESVYILSRVFNIHDINNFQFKHEVYSGNSLRKTIYSAVYYPNRSWWAETYAWNDMGIFSVGEYTVRTSISVDGYSFQLLDTERFQVTGSYYNNYYNDDYNYVHGWTHTGKGIWNRSENNYELVDVGESFSSKDSIYLLTKLNDLRNVDTFHLKYDVYFDGTGFYKSVKSSVQEIDDYRVDDYYVWGSVGALPQGHHKIIVEISINNGRYVKIADKDVYVNYYNNYNYTNYNYYDRADCDNYGYCNTNTNYNGNYYNDGYYDYRYTGDFDYDYEIQDFKNVFFENEDVMITTKISNIRGVDTLKVKHELYDDNKLKKRKITTKNLDYRGLNVYYATANFGDLSEGDDYKIKVYIKVNDKDYKYLGSKKIEVEEFDWDDRRCYGTDSRYCDDDDRYYRRPGYKYEWSKTGTVRRR